MLARNRYNLTKQTLDSLVLTTMPYSHLIDITIVDDRSDEPTRGLLKEYAALRNDTPMGTGTLRNLSIHETEKRMGRGDYLCISDNDVYFYANWLLAMVRVYEAVERFGFRVIGACNHPFHQPGFTVPVIHPLLSGQAIVVSEVSALASQSMMMKWETFDKFGPFCETPVDKVCQSEDVAFSNKVKEAGFKVGVVNPAFAVNCGITNSFGEHIPGWELVKSQAPQGVIVE